MPSRVPGLGSQLLESVAGRLDHAAETHQIVFAASVEDTALSAGCIDRRPWCGHRVI